MFLPMVESVDTKYAVAKTQADSFLPHTYLVTDGISISIHNVKSTRGYPVVHQKILFYFLVVPFFVVLTLGVLDAEREYYTVYQTSVNYFTCGVECNGAENIAIEDLWT